MRAQTPRALTFPTRVTLIILTLEHFFSPYFSFILAHKIKFNLLYKGRIFYGEKKRKGPKDKQIDLNINEKKERKGRKKEREELLG